MNLIRSDVTRFIRNTKSTPTKVYWPHGESQLDSKRFIKLARGRGVLDVEIQFILWRFDREGWLKAEKNVTRKAVRFEIIVDNYLKEE
jgi:hypothetical protein